MKRALITGITGQDGSYLAEFLLSKGYEVHGTQRRSSTFNTSRIDHIYDRLKCHHADLTDASSMRRVLKAVMPDEIYNLAAQSHVAVSFQEPELTMQVNGLAVVSLLESVREICPTVKFYQASTSELFGDAIPPQHEAIPFRPKSPYAIAKHVAYQAVKMNVESYGMFAVNGILFNHESPRRGETFVTRKVTKAAARIKLGKQKSLVLGNLMAMRDWGYAPEYVEAMWLMLQQKEPVDLVIGTGKSHSVLDLVEKAFGLLDLPWREYVRTSPSYERPTDVECLRADATLAEKSIGWKSKTTFDDLVSLMVLSDLEHEKKS